MQEHDVTRHHRFRGYDNPSAIAENGGLQGQSCGLARDPFENLLDREAMPGNGRCADGLLSHGIPPIVSALAESILVT
jgi:hypothetical protein